MTGGRKRPHLRGPIWIIVLLAFVSLFLIVAYVYPPKSSASCYITGSCAWYQQPSVIPARELTDDETASRIIVKEILRMVPYIQSKKPKVAFMFLTAMALPFEMLWDKFFHGHENKFTVYVHASSEKPTHVSRYFIGRDIHSEKVAWGRISMIDAERRLLANALLDPDNQHFVLLSESCVPLRSFEYVYDYLLFANLSFVDCFVDPGPHGNGRYSEHMMPEVEKKDFRKGSQWFSLKRQHAILVMADSLYYTKFKLFCKPNMDGRNCYADEHYLPTFLHMIDPGGIANWSVTHVDWSEGKWHPKTYWAVDVRFDLIKNITSIDEGVHVTSDAKDPCYSAPAISLALHKTSQWKTLKMAKSAIVLDRLVSVISQVPDFCGSCKQFTSCCLPEPSGFTIHRTCCCFSKEIDNRDSISRICYIFCDFCLVRKTEMFDFSEIKGIDLEF